MKRIRLMPAGSLESLEHLYASIINPVSKEALKSYLEPQDLMRLDEIFSGNEIAIWGFEPGKVNNPAWENLLLGDFLIFVPSNQDLIITELKYKIKNSKLAERLWGVSKRSGQLWELLLFVKILSFINIDKRDLLNQLGYSEEDYLRGSRDVTDRFLDTFGSIESFIRKYSRPDFNLEFFKTMSPKEILKRNIREEGEDRLNRQELEEFRLLQEEIPKFENLVDIPGFPTKEKIEGMKKRFEELKVKTAQFKEGNELEASAKKGEVRLRKK